jgi:inorganic triphosphatase YgiF
MPEPSREFELKFDLTGAELSRLARNPKLKSNGPRAPRALRSVYFDTPDFRLHAKGISFRVRSDGPAYIQTIKLDTRLKHGLSTPVEIEDHLESPNPDITRIHDRRVRRKVAKAVKGSSLTKAFEMFVTRTTHRINARGSIIEIALDKGETLALDRRSEICEAELELIKGHPRDLLQIAQVLFAKSSVRLSPASKAERGFRLILKSRPAQKIEPVRAAAPAIHRGQTGGEAFAEILRSSREQIVKNRSVVLETGEAEGAHQLRVGLTRLRSAERALRALLNSPQLSQLEAEAQTLARAVGRLRDADVLIDTIYAPVAGDPPRKAGFDELRDALRAHRAAMQAEARAALTSEAWSRLLLSLTLWPAMLERDPSLQKPVEKYAGKLLQKPWKRSAKLGHSIATMAGERRHKMRKSLKKLRYTVEFLAPLYHSPDVKAFVKQLKKLQDVFGYVNDVRMAGQLSDIATEYGGEHPAPLFAAGFVLGHHGAKAAEVWDEAPKAWHRLKASGLFWK